MKLKDFHQAALEAARAADDKKAMDVVVLDIHKQSDLADFMVLASAESSVQLRAIHEAIKDALRALGLKPLHQDGTRGDQWIAIDYGGLLIHLMRTDVRQLYRLEGLWNSPKGLAWEEKKEKKVKNAKPATKTKKVPGRARKRASR